MNEPFDPVRYALDDDELDRLLVGAADPLGPDLDRNPVASFLTEARRTTFATNPRPNDGLVALFARVPSGPESVAPPTSSLSVIDRPPAGEPAGWMVAAQTASNGAGGADPAGAAGSESFTLGDGESRRVVSAPNRVYRPSVLDAIVQTLRPTTTKVLMGLSLVLLLLIAGQAVGVIGLPSGDEAQTVAGIDSSSVPATVEDTAPAPAVETSETALPPPTVTTVGPAPSEPPSSTTTTPTIATTTPTIATSAPTAPTSSTTTPTIATSATTATTVSTTTTVVEATTPTSVVATSATVTVVEPSPTTERPVVILVPGLAATVPGDVPPGAYRATVDDPLGCTVVVVNADGSQSTHQAGAGSEIAFQLIVGSQVVTSGGCPQVYQPVVG